MNGNKLIALARQDVAPQAPGARPDPRQETPRTHLHLVAPAPRLDPVLLRRDPEFIRRIYPIMAAISDRYYRGEVEGAEHLSEGASLMVATHNGGMFTPDAYAELLAFWRRFGLETPLYMLGHRMIDSIPLLGPLAEKIGTIPASWRNAEVALRANFPVLVCPGGDEDSLKPFRKRHTICFGRRDGFVRLAIREQVPIIPMVSVGAHETIIVLNDGRWLARSLRLDRMFRIKTAPLALGFPWGLTIAGLGAWPLPTKVKVRILPPMDLGVPARLADDPATVSACFDRVTRTMQRALSEMAAARRFPILG